MFDRLPGNEETQEGQTPGSQTSPDSMTAEQHLAMAEVIKASIGQPGGPTRAEGLRMIRNHEVMARVRQQQLMTQDGASSPT